MSDPVLHIKDSFFFEVPKVLAPSNFQKREEFPDVWISLDPEFQDWEFKRLYEALREHNVQLPPEETAHEDWHEWVHGDHANFAKPFSEFLEHKYRDHLAKFNAWKAAQAAAAKTEQERKAAQNQDFDRFLRSGELAVDPYNQWSELRNTHEFRGKWAAMRHEAGSVEAWRKDPAVHEWSAEKIAAYNKHLSGKILIPQPFGRLRNLHEPATTLINPTDRLETDGIINHDDFGFCISRFMLIEVAVGLILWMLFSWVATRLMRGGPPRGRMWNLLESFVSFIREQIARPALGGGHDSHDDGHHGAEHHDKGHHAEPAHAIKHAAHHHDHDDPVTRYTPILCTIFFFILGCNLAGMLPWVGSPTGTWAVTLAMAFITLGAVTVAGMRQFGFFGFFLNQIPSMDLPWYMAVILKPILLVIELLGFVIKHGVLSVRLLANMLAGHMVLLAIMSIAFGLEAMLTFTQPDGTVSIFWWIASISSIVGCTLLSLLELFVAFLQAYVFTLLSALFIGAAIHKH